MCSPGSDTLAGMPDDSDAHDRATRCGAGATGGSGSRYRDSGALRTPDPPDVVGREAGGLARHAEDVAGIEAHGQLIVRPGSRVGDREIVEVEQGQKRPTSSAPGAVPGVTPNMVS